MLLWCRTRFYLESSRGRHVPGSDHQNQETDLAELPRGVQKLAGVDFDLRGLIQVGSSSRGGVPYPKELSGIPMKRACRLLHFVHSAIMAYDVQPGTKIGSYVVYYVDGQTREIPIIVERDVADWFSQANENLRDLQIAWSGRNEASRTAGRTIRLFKSTWQNPVSELAIQSLDFVSSHHSAAPFLVAITAE
jgi:hypothetical protein